MREGANAGQMPTCLLALFYDVFIMSMCGFIVQLGTGGFAGTWIRRHVGISHLS